MTIKAVKRAMVITAHPDDPEYFCAGTIALWVADGIEISYLILTSGNKGSNDPQMTPEILATTRKKEQQEAANLLGVKRVLYLDEPDGELQPTLELRKKIVAEIRRYQPEIVITFDPTCFFIAGTQHLNHSDHRNTGVAAIDAIFPAAGNRMYHPELLEQGLEPHTVKEIYLTGSNKPNLWVNISPVFDTKLQAILCHTSQIKNPETMRERRIKEHTDIDQYGQEILREKFRVIKIK